jgi:septal ring factor EnvC (AmiA/AmiB activator)
MGRRDHQEPGGDVDILVEEIEQTGDRLAAAVEALAFKKAHLKDEVIELAEEKADQFLEKAEETKDQLVAKISEKIPDRSELKAMASSVAAKIGDSAAEAKDAVVGKAAEAKDAVVGKAAEAKDAVVGKAAEAEQRIAAVAAERLPEVTEAASDVAGKVVDTVARAGETAASRLRHPTRHPAVGNTPEN